MEKPQSDVIAKQLILEIMYDNGMVYRGKKEDYPKKYLDLISESAGIFFDKNPDFLTNEDIIQICCGEVSENEIKYGKLDGYKELLEALNKYFNQQ